MLVLTVAEKDNLLLDQGKGRAGFVSLVIDRIEYHQSQDEDNQELQKEIAFTKIADVFFHFLSSLFESSRIVVRKKITTSCPRRPHNQNTLLDSPA